MLAGGDISDDTMWAWTSSPAFLQFFAHVPIEVDVDVRCKCIWSWWPPSVLLFAVFAAWPAAQALRWGTCRPYGKNVFRVSVPPSYRGQGILIPRRHPMANLLRSLKDWDPRVGDNVYGVHPAEPVLGASQDKAESDKRHVFACIMATSKDYVGDITRSMPLQEALGTQNKVGEHVQFSAEDAEGLD